jgi:aerobic-type carbon monoxide dehydrogenase small subunit (CoxS/CutS family)
VNTITIKVNGLSREVNVDDNELLLNVLRDKMLVARALKEVFGGSQ